MRNNYMTFDYDGFVNFYNETFASKLNSRTLTIDDVYRAIPAAQFDDENEFCVYDSFKQFYVTYEGEPFVVLLERDVQQTKTEPEDDDNEELPEPF